MSKKEETHDLNNAVVGIDLGTTYSVVGSCRNGRCEIFANDNGNRTTPSIVGFMDGMSFVGDAAKDLPAVNQVFDAKRLVGRQWADLDVQKDMGVWPFSVVEQGGVPRITLEVGGKKESFAPEEISAMVLSDLKKTAEAALEKTVSKAVVTVPAYFNERQRQATKDACKIAGLEVLAMINEPTAAAIAYGLEREKGVDSAKTVFIFDLGGGTFDVSVVKISGSSFQVLASGGDTHLGGQDFDVLLLEHCLEDLKKTLPAAGQRALTDDKQAVLDLRKACELAKRKLSSMPQAPVSVFFPRINKTYQTTITRALFEDLCTSLFKKTIEVSEQVLADAKVTRAEVHDVVLVGGSTRIPKVRALLKDMFGGKELRQSINPDEAVAHGAAMHAAVVSGDKFFDKLVKLKDVTPLSLGIDLVGDLFDAVIVRNTPIPCKNTMSYESAYDNQRIMSANIYQGERPLVKDNFDLNKKFSIKVPRRPQGEVCIKITFEIDESGLLTVTAVEPTSGRQVRVQITSEETSLSEADIQSMMVKARRLRSEDEESVRQVERELQSKRARLE